MKIFSGSSNKPLAEQIAKLLNLTLSRCEIHTFSDGEKRVRLLEPVLDEEVVIVASTGIPVDDNYMELFFLIDAVKRSGSKKITGVIPYMGYTRQDHVFRSGEARSFGVIVKTLEGVGCDKLVTFDLHSIKIPELFKIPVEHLSAISLFANKIRELIHPGAVLVSPDMGGVRRIKLLSEMLGAMPYLVVEKNRDLATGEISGKLLEGETGKVAFVVDDMISSGKTIAQAARLLKERRAKKVYAFATHAVFSEDAGDILEGSEIERIYVTDTIEVPKEKQFVKLKILSVVDLIAKELFQE